ncbi:hypothetical protein ABK040_010541 [Willaertia magna]
METPTIIDNQHNDNIFTHEILIYNTGGTLSCTMQENRLHPTKGIIEKEIKEKEILREFTEQKNDPSQQQIQHRYTYNIKEMDPFIDSADATIETWNNILLDIQKEMMDTTSDKNACDNAQYDKNTTNHNENNNYQKKKKKKYCGVIIISGTDTLSYLASAIAMGLKEMEEIIILIGSQYPLTYVNTDATGNLYGAFKSIVELHRQGHRGSKFVFFNHKLMRATRIRKIHTSFVNAFESVNSPTIGLIQGNDLQFNLNYLRMISKRKFKNDRVNLFSDKCAMLKIYPGSQVEELSFSADRFVTILLTYGAGNLPKRMKERMDEMEDKIFFACSECYHGKSNDNYHVSAQSENCILLIDMTPDAAYIKSSMLLKKFQDKFDCFLSLENNNTQKANWLCKNLTHLQKEKLYWEFFNENLMTITKFTLRAQIYTHPEKEKLIDIIYKFKNGKELKQQKINFNLTRDAPIEDEIDYEEECSDFIKTLNDKMKRNLNNKDYLKLLENVCEIDFIRESPLLPFYFKESIEGNLTKKLLNCWLKLLEDEKGQHLLSKSINKGHGYGSGSNGSDHGETLIEEKNNDSNNKDNNSSKTFIREEEEMNEMNEILEKITFKLVFQIEMLLTFVGEITNTESRKSKDSFLLGNV